MSKRVVEVPAPVAVTPESLRRLVQNINKQLHALQLQIDEIKSRGGD